MKKLLLILSTLAFVNSTFAAEADNDKPYVEIGYTKLTYKEDPYTLTPSNIRFIVGKNDGNFGYEALLGVNSSSDSVTVSSVSVDYKINYIFGIYGKALTHINDDIELFGRLGYAKFTGTASASSISVDNSGSGLSYGIGAKYKISKDVNLNLDYMVYYPAKDGFTLNGYTIGLGYNF